MSDIETATPLFKAMNQFMPYFNMMFNLFYTKTKQAEGMRDYMALYSYLYALPVVVANMIGVAARGDWPDDEDDDNGTMLDNYVWELLLLPQVKGAFAFVPIIGGTVGAEVNGLINAAAGEQVQDRTSTAPFQSVIMRAGRSFRTVPEAIFFDGDASKAWMDGVTLFGLTTGYPLKQLIVKPIGYDINIFEDDKEDRNIVQGIITGASRANR
jgi:hypothetical protein